MVNHPDDCHIGDVKFGKASLLTIAACADPTEWLQADCTWAIESGVQPFHYHEQSQMGLSEDLL